MKTNRSWTKACSVLLLASGGFALAAAQIDPRMKAVATVSMYDMGGANREKSSIGVAVDVCRPTDAIHDLALISCACLPK